MEVQFDICDVVDPNTKRAHILAAIPEQQRALFLDAYTANDRSQAGYDNLVARVRELFREKPRQRAARLLQPFNLNGETPSRFMAGLRCKAMDLDFEMLLKEIMAAVLPPDIRAHVASDTISANDMAKKADDFYTSSGQRIQQPSPGAVCSAAPAHISQPIDDEWDAETLSDEHQEQTYASACAANYGPPRQSGGWTKVQHRRPRPQPQNDRPQPRPFQRQPMGRQPQEHQRQRRDADANPDHCFYHRRFGNEARNCRQGCPRWGNARPGGQL